MGPKIGSGATGTMFAASEMRGGHKVAVKIIHPHLTRDDRVRLEFLNQVRQVASIREPGFLPVLGAGETSAGLVYVASELTRGHPLTDLINDAGPMLLEEAAPLLLALARILAFAHDQGLIHGNLSPENIWLIPHKSGLWPPEVEVTDFGMSLLHRPERPEDEARPPYYLSPEQCRQEPSNINPDTYAFGVITFQMLTGRLPFSSPKPTEVLQMHLDREPPAPGEIVPLSPETELFLYQALAKDPLYRFLDMHLVIEVLESLVKPEVLSEPRAPARLGQRVAGAEILSQEVDLDGRDRNMVVMVVDPAGLGPAGKRAKAPSVEERTAASGVIVQEPSSVEESLGRAATMRESPAVDEPPVIVEEGLPAEVRAESLVRPGLSARVAEPLDENDDLEEDEDLESYEVSYETSEKEEGAEEILVRPRSRVAQLLIHSTDILPGRTGLGRSVNPLLSAFLGILTAVSVWVVTYRLLTGQWPFPLGH